MTVLSEKTGYTELSWNPGIRKCQGGVVGKEGRN
jgi:hypothetical protein